MSGEREGRPDTRPGTLNPLLPLCLSLLLSFAFVLERDFDIEPVDVRAAVDFGFVVLLMEEVDGRGGLNVFGGIVVSF